MTCVYTPYYLAFPDYTNNVSALLDDTMNIVFGIDLIIQFFSAYYDEDY